MKPHLATYVSWGILSLAEAILVAVILYRRATARWPFLLAITLFDLAYSAVLYAVIANCTTYFDIFWYGQGIRSLLSLGLLWDIARSIPGLQYVPKRVGAFLITLGLTITVGSVLLTMQHHSNTEHIAAEVYMIRECVSVAWLCCAFTLLFSVSLLGMGWKKDGLYITAGFVFSGMTAVAASHFMVSYPQYHARIDFVQTCFETAVLVFWSVMLCRCSAPDEDLSGSVLAVINELLEE